MNNTFLDDMLHEAIDIHFHIGPEPIPRKFTVENLIRSEAGKLRGVVLKNHFFPTSPFIQEVGDTKGLKLIGSVVLNHFVGGLNPEVLRGLSMLSDEPFMVWFPTVHAQQFLDESEWEIAPEWVKREGFQSRKARDIVPVEVVTEGKLTDAAVAVLKTVKELNLTLATGHISAQESVLLVKKAAKIGIKKMVITHPIYQKIDMPVSTQRELARLGCFMEMCYSMHSIDQVPLSKILEQIRQVGPESMIVSSDVGQTFSPAPSVALKKFAHALLDEGISEDEVYTMFVVNPRKVVF